MSKSTMKLGMSGENKPIKICTTVIPSFITVQILPGDDLSTNRFVPKAILYLRDDEIDVLEDAITIYRRHNQQMKGEW